MRAYYEELFGPVAVVHKVDSIDDAITLANDSPYGLGSAVFTTSEALANQVADRLDVGMVGLNTTIKSAPDLPFGGVKNSGLGRELGRFGIDEFSNKKLIRISEARSCRLMTTNRESPQVEQNPAPAQRTSRQREPR
jgi:succinate-semialdehyde dehydrogenase/glutarate-semialdehyde dehydrogenase